jgi:hypothetical protein
MLGLHNVSVLTAYLFSILSAILCVIYGIVNWNRDNGESKEGKDK